MTERRLRVSIGVVATIGIGIATYLTYIHYAGIKPFCLSSGGCETVQSSKWAMQFGIPVAVLGLAGYVLILISAIIPGDLGRASGAFLGIGGCGFSLYLTYLELFRIHAICQWCVVSAILMTVLAVITTWRLLKTDVIDVGSGDFGEVDEDEASTTDPTAGPAGSSSQIT